MIGELRTRGKNLNAQIEEMRYDDQLVFRTSQQNVVVAKTVLDSITPLIKNNKALAPALRRINAVLTIADVQEQSHRSTNSAPSQRGKYGPQSQSRDDPNQDHIALSQGGAARSQVWSDPGCERPEASQTSSARQ